MNWLVDAQLPKSLSDFLNARGHDAIHTLDLPDKNKTKDSQIISLAVIENRVLISKDNDFLESFMLTGQPPKLLMVRTGNISNPELLHIFRRHLDTITGQFAVHSLIELARAEIIVHQ